MTIIAVILASICLFIISIADSQIESCPLTELDVWTTGEGKLFYVKVEIGEGDNRQPFNLLVSTWNHDFTWVASKNGSQNRGYSNSSTQTGRLRNVAVRQIQYRATVHSDTWHLGPLRFANQPFIVLSPSSASEQTALKTEVDGILSLGTGDRLPKPTGEPHTRLENSDLTRGLGYSLYINRTIDLLAGLPVGKLILGGVDERYYTGEVTYIPSHWYGVKETIGRGVTRVRLDWSRVDQTLVALIKRVGGIDLGVKPKSFKLDIATIQYAGPQEDLDRIHLDFLGAKLIMYRSIYAFNDCVRDNKPDIVFELAEGAFTVTLTPDDYLIKSKIQGRIICISAFKRMFIDTWLFGTQFLRKYYTIFDPEHLRVGLAAPV